MGREEKGEGEGKRGEGGEGGRGRQRREGLGRGGEGGGGGNMYQPSMTPPFPGPLATISMRSFNMLIYSKKEMGEVGVRGEQS